MPILFRCPEKLYKFAHSGRSKGHQAVVLPMIGLDGGRIIDTAGVGRERYRTCPIIRGVTSCADHQSH